MESLAASTWQFRPAELATPTPRRPTGKPGDGLNAQLIDRNCKLIDRNCKLAACGLWALEIGYGTMSAVTTQAAPATSEEELREWIVAQGEQRGNAVITVPPDDSGSGYSFTVCAWVLHEVAEAVVVGLPDHIAPILLDAYVDRAAAGERFECGKVYDDFFEGVPLTFEWVAKGHYPEFFGSAFLVYPDGDFPAVQIIVATPDGHWPWATDAPEGFAEWQPVLTVSGRPETWTPRTDGP